ncbi:MBL fold metallo-hydrolase [Nanoarchaeota archaeon]
MKIQWIRHASVIIKTKQKTIYIDPYLDPLFHTNLPKADIILISTSLPNHFTNESIEMIKSRNTRIYAVSSASERLGGAIVKAGDTIEEQGLKFHCSKTYNENAPEAVGFILQLQDKRIYYVGSTFYNPELRHTCNILIIPIGGSTSMNIDQAAQLTEQIRPKYVLPIQYGLSEGMSEEGDLFKSRIEDKKITIPIVLEEMNEFKVE